MNTITLKNGATIELQWNLLIFQYLEEYEGGLKKLKYDLKHKINLLKIENIFVYASLRANYKKPLSYYDAIRLVNVEDMQIINDFVQKNLEEQTAFKKKEQPFSQKKKKKK